MANCYIYASEWFFAKILAFIGSKALLKMLVWEYLKAPSGRAQAL
jgi:hypothetical protein